MKPAKTSNVDNYGKTRGTGERFGRGIYPQKGHSGCGGRPYHKATLSTFCQPFAPLLKRTNVRAL